MTLHASIRRAASRLAKSLLRAVGVRHVTRRVHGHAYRVPLDSTSLRRLFVRRDDAYEGAFYPAVLALVPPGGTAFDVGAHLGEYAVGLSRRVGPGGHVVAFEANPVTAAQLREVVRVNGLDNARVEAVALGEHEGEVEMALAGAGHAPGQSLLASPTATGDRCTVPMTSLDAFVLATGLQPDLVKIDVEGFELHVLAGARHVLETASPIVCVEVHPARLQSIGRSAEDVDAVLAGLGYATTSHSYDHDESGRREGAPYNVVYEKRPASPASATAV